MATGGPPGRAAPRQDRIAALGLRLAGRIVDGVLLSIPYAILLAATLQMLATKIDCTRGVDGSPDCSGSEIGAGDVLVIVLLFALFLLFVALYEILLVGLTGATLGKRLIGLRVVDLETGGHIGVVRSFLRSFTLVLTGSVFFLGWFSPLFDKTGNNRGWHDLVAGDVVVKRAR